MNKHRMLGIVSTTRRILLAVALAAAVVAIPAAPARAAATCNGLPVTISGTPGNDVITGTAGPDVIAAGNGNDTVFGLAGNDVACLGFGDDVFEGGNGNDTSRGEWGDDFFIGGRGNDTAVAEGCSLPFPVPNCVVLDGADTFIGGAGVDTANYSARVAGLIISLNDVANDGHVGENDNNRSDVENAIGGGGPDGISGNALRNNLNGGFGNDFIQAVDGVGGNDVVVGLIGFDRCSADQGDTKLSCEA